MVLDTNPSLDAAQAAWRASLATYYERDALPDPSLSYTFAPASIFDPSVRYGQVIALKQTFPWPGKLSAKGDVALFEAEMSAEDYQTARLDLALRTCRLYDHYYVVERSLEINAAHTALVEQLRKSIASQYAVGKASLYDALQADVVVTHLLHERTVLETERSVTVAQLNTLMHRAPGAHLAPPPQRLEALPASSDSAPTLAGLALETRPELRALAAKRSSAESAIDLAERDYFPDVTLFGSYNSMWSMVSHQFMVGASVNLPIQLGRREGAERRARARLTEADSEAIAMSDAIRSEIHQALARLAEAHHVATLYEERLIPLANKQIVAVRSAFATDDANFFEVLAAERSRWTAKQQHHAALAQLWTRRSELVRALGQIPGLEQGGADR